MNTKNIHIELKSTNIFALYEDGEFSTTQNLRDEWVMLIDIGRHRHTIMTNSKTTIDAIELFGQFWIKHDAQYTGTYLVINDDWAEQECTAPGT